jgi:hypothetical protein
MAVSYGLKGFERRGFTMNISPTGLAIRTSQVFPPGTRLFIRLEANESMPTGCGTVRWAKQVPPLLINYTHCGMGIEFTELSPSLKEFLERLEQKESRPKES